MSQKVKRKSEHERRDREKIKKGRKKTKNNMSTFLFATLTQRTFYVQSGAIWKDLIVYFDNYFLIFSSVGESELMVDFKNKMSVN